MGINFGLLKFQIFFGVLEIPDIFWGRRVDAGPEPTYGEKLRVPPGGCCQLQAKVCAQSTVKLGKEKWA